MMKIEELPQEIKTVLDEWFTSSFDLLHFWEQDETYFIVIRNEGELYFVRIFQVFSKWVLSQDKVVEEAR